MYMVIAAGKSGLWTVHGVIHNYVNNIQNYSLISVDRLFEMCEYLKYNGH